MKTRTISILFVVLVTVCLTAGPALAADTTGFESLDHLSAVAAPTLTVTTSGTTVSLSWSSVAGATGYTLYYAPYPYTGPDSIQNIGMATQTGGSFDLWDGAAFYVAVEAYDSVESSGYSNIELFTIDSGRSNWTFTEDNVSLGIQGVSPETVLLTDGSVRLHVTDMGIKTYKSSNGLNFTEETASPPQGSDPSLIKLDDGTYRMYYVDLNSIWTATSSDGLNWTKESNTGISNTSGGQAWGVPDSIELPDGRIRLYWVDMPSESNYEVIKSAISSDGVTFALESGFRTQDGYVDSYVLKAEEGNWVGLFATTPTQERLPQQIYIGTSSDGLTWSIASSPIITVSAGNALDPTAVPLGDGSYRVYYASTPNADPFADFSLRNGILKPN